VPGPIGDFDFLYCNLGTSRSRWPRGLRPLSYWDGGFESLRRHGYLSHVSVMFCQVMVSATGRSRVESSLTECDFET
jgi:hypothetical protein